MKIFKISFFMTALVLLFAGCNKKDYYKDGGLQDGKFNGTVMQFLESRPDLFKTLVSVIKYAGMEQVMSSENITFFAPADSSIRNTIESSNIILAAYGKSPITTIQDIKPELWRKYLSMYIFKGTKSLQDYPQIDIGNLSAYSGQMYTSYDGTPMNVGVIFNDANGVKYAGYRQLMLSLVNGSTPRDYTTWRSAYVATVNIKPTNGYVHVLRYGTHEFGFWAIEFGLDLVYNN
ncbi:MAG: fasciclin domain-containing protein [Niabella sp.]